MKHKIVRFVLPLCYILYVIYEIYFLITYDYNSIILRLPLERLDINLAKIIFSLVIAESIRKQIVDKLYVISLMGISTTLLVDKLFGLTANGSIPDLLEFVEILSVLLLIFFLIEMKRKINLKSINLF